MIFRFESSSEHRHNDFFWSQLIGRMAQQFPGDRFLIPPPLYAPGDWSSVNNIQPDSGQTEEWASGPFTKGWRRLFGGDQKKADRIFSLQVPNRKPGRNECLVLADPVLQKGKKSYRKYLRELLQNRGRVITFFPRLKNDLESGYAVPAQHISLFPFFPLWPPGASAASARAIKEKYTEGREFFLVHLEGSSNADFVRMLQGFSQFKKWQQSSFHLLFRVGMHQLGSCRETLKGYKYANDIHLQPTTEESPLEGAFAVLIPDAYPGYISALLEALSKKIPTLAPVSPWEAGRELLLSTDMRDTASLSAQLIRIYQDESLRRRVTEEAYDQLLGAAQEPSMAMIRNLLHPTLDEFK